MNDPRSRGGAANASAVTLIAQVRRTIAQRGLIAAGARVLCACSGGPDSAAMMFALARLGPELGFALEVASVDHGLRPQAALDVALARGQAESLGLRFHALRVEVAPGGSLQAKARTARYAALKGLAAELEATRIAVGHTLDDQAETVLLRILRGSGLRGLAAIEPQRADGVIRPLIDCERAEAHRLARAQFAQIAVDPSNTDLRFERVRIRTHLLPSMRAENPRLNAHLAALADEARAYRAPLSAAAGALLAGARRGESLVISALADRPVGLRRAALRAWLEEAGAGPLSRAHLSALDYAVCAGRGHIWLRGGFGVQVDTLDGVPALRLLARRPKAHDLT